MTSYVCEHAECQAEGTEAMPAGERYCAEHAPEPLAMWSWGDDRFSPPYGKAGVEQAIAESMVQDLDNSKAGTVTGPDGIEYQVNIAVTLTPVLVAANG